MSQGLGLTDAPVEREDPKEAARGRKVVLLPKYFPTTHVY